MTTQIKIEHRGITITYDEDRWIAEINSIERRFVILSDAKAAIDKAYLKNGTAKKRADQPVLMMKWARTGQKMVVGTITTFVDKKSVHSSEEAWVTWADKTRSKEGLISLYPDTPENRKTLEKVAELDTAGILMRERANKMRENIKNVKYPEPEA